MFQSQIGQDRFVCEMLNNKRDGTFLDVGCHDFINISNTYYLEKELNWKGIAIDFADHYRGGWVNNRTNSIFVCADATKLDYGKLLTDNNFELEIDYLSLDLEPPEITLKALYQIFKSDLKFKVITFETDNYSVDITKQHTQEASRNFLKERGYELIKPGNQDDFYIYRGN